MHSSFGVCAGVTSPAAAGPPPCCRPPAAGPRPAARALLARAYLRLTLRGVCPCLSQTGATHTHDPAARLFEGAPEYSHLKLSSLYFEVGETSFMKEAVASQVGG